MTYGVSSALPFNEEFCAASASPTFAGRMGRIVERPSAVLAAKGGT
jgi:hypothetical protein